MFLVLAHNVTETIYIVLITSTIINPILYVVSNSL